jgi:membrane-bound lytic murein transglycosylase D
MQRLQKIFIRLIVFVCICLQKEVSAHDIYFCGEKIPVANNFVSSKLMDVIRRQIPNVNLPQLRKRAKENFPRVEYYLRATGLPIDLKYLAIVESGFLNAESSAGARGFWQLMPKTAREKGLIVSDLLDERDDIDKSTRAACYLLGEYYISIQKKFKISSWVLAAAAYNIGIGNIHKTVEKQGADYFSMNLNAETAVYVYKIIAIKELFEFPEFYMKDFGYNVFNKQKPESIIELGNNDDDNSAVFNTIQLQIPKEKAEKTQKKVENYRFLGAKIRGKYTGFNDRDLVTIELYENFELKGNFRSKGTIIKGTGWIIDGKVFIDLGYDHDVIIYDKNGNGGKPGEQGIDLSTLKDKEPILLKVKNYNAE